MYKAALTRQDLDVKIEIYEITQKSLRRVD